MANDANLEIRMLVANARERGEVVNIRALARKLNETHPWYGLAKLHDMVVREAGRTNANASWDRSE